MGRLFNMDNPFFRFMGKMVDVLWLNIIWLVFSLPIVTIGASTTAMICVMMKVVRDREGYIWRDFWKSFKINFKQSTIMWIGIILVYSVCMILSVVKKFSVFMLIGFDFCFLTSGEGCG